MRAPQNVGGHVLGSRTAMWCPGSCHCRWCSGCSSHGHLLGPPMTFLEVVIQPRCSPWMPCSHLVLDSRTLAIQGVEVPNRAQGISEHQIHSQPGRAWAQDPICPFKPGVPGSGHVHLQL